MMNQCDVFYFVFFYRSIFAKADIFYLINNNISYYFPLWCYKECYSFCYHCYTYCIIYSYKVTHAPASVFFFCLEVSKTKNSTDCCYRHCIALKNFKNVKLQPYIWLLPSAYSRVLKSIHVSNILEKWYHISAIIYTWNYCLNHHDRK